MRSMISSSTLRVGIVQMCSSRDVGRNIRDAAAYIREAHAQGAKFIATPEMTNILDTDRKRVAASVDEERTDAAVRRFSDLAQELRVHLLIGSMALGSGNGRLVNRSLLFDASGKVVARYDKIHMFDVDLSERSFRESASYESGDKAVVANLPWAALGLTICYDIRFPYLYRTLAKAGATLLSVPSAFTRITGEAHWEVLMRARAIENGAFIIAPAQTGRHECGRESYGHSLVIDPWGSVLSDGGTEPGISIVELEPGKAREVRRRIPVLQAEGAGACVQFKPSGKGSP
jgi:deaminated glutathione amidase